MVSSPARCLSVVAGFLIAGIIMTGCGKSTDTHSPDPIITSGAISADSMESSGRLLWGLWNIGINTTSGDVEIVPVRGAEFHLNALGFLEPPALTGLAIDNGTIFMDQGNNYIEVDVILNHPFPGSSQFSGFDVRGIVIMPGADIPFSDWSLTFPGTATPHLVNPDGYTRWWNPKEFPGTGIFAYKNGLLGTQGGPGYFTATVNSYKYFADDLGSTNDVTEMDNNKRGAFSAGMSNKRQYKLSFGDNPSEWLHFQYAVDASWAAPYTMDNPIVPDQFPLEANAPEGYAVEITETSNSLWWIEGIGMGGELNLDIDIYSWRPEEITRVLFEAPGIISTSIEGTPIIGSGGGPDDAVYSTYQFEIQPDILSSDGAQQCLIMVETDQLYTQDGTTSFFGPAGALVTGYYRHETTANFTPPLKWEFVTAKLLEHQPATVIKEMSVVGSGPFEGVYYFGDDYELYRYDSLYQGYSQVSTLAGFFGYNELELYGAPETLGRFDLCPFGQFVCSTISAAASPTFLGGLKRDYAFFFNECYSLSGQLPIQIGVPDPEAGYFEFIDVSANWADDVEDAKIYWIQVDDPDESTPMGEGITVILGVYQHGFSGNPFSLDIDYLSATLVPAGSGNGEVDLASIERFAIDGDPAGLTGSSDLAAWFLETDPPALECFSIVSTDGSGDLNQSLTTINSFHATPRDIEVIPAVDGGYGVYNWVVVLEEGTGNWSIETFDQSGASWVSIYDIPGYPVCMDVDPDNYRIHVWFTPELDGDVYSAVLELKLGD